MGMVQGLDKGTKMIKQISILALIMAILLLPGHAVMAATVNNGQIEGSLINRTAGTTSTVADQQITLNVYQGNNESGSQTTRTDQEGKYVFSGLSTDSSYVYQVELNYEGADYYSQPIQFETGENVQSADIDVYDTTTSDEAISVSMSYVVIARQNDNLAITEYYLFADNSDRAYIGSPTADSGEKRETLRFSLPQGATDMQTILGLTDSSIIRKGNDFIDTEAVTPEGSGISFSYLIPINSARQTLSWTLNYNIVRFDVLYKDSSIQVTSDKLTQQNPLNIDGQSYHDYAAQNLPRGDTVNITLSGLTGKSGVDFLKWAWLAILPLGGLGYFLIKRKKAATTSIADDREHLLGEIAELDNSYAGGEIDEDDYRKLRQQKEEQLAQLAQIQKDSIKDEEGD